jgi:hypothetical protein
MSSSGCCLGDILICKTEICVNGFVDFYGDLFTSSEENFFLSLHNAICVMTYDIRYADITISLDFEYEQEADIHTDDRQRDDAHGSYQWRRYKICQRIVL